MFMHFNNGVTILCDDAKMCDFGKEKGMQIQHPQIINGQQTTRCLARSKNSKKATVLVKIIKLDRKLEKNTKYFHKTIGEIVKATNSQTPVTASDLVSNDSRQLAIDKALRKEGFIYLRKRETRGESNKRFGKGKSRRFIAKLDLATAVASCEFDQKIVRSSREHLFEGNLYRKTFPTTKPYYYLLRYFLYKTVKKVSSENPNWSYARALAIGYIWKHIQEHVDHNVDSRRRFVAGCQNINHPIYNAVTAAARSTFRSLNNFYKDNRGTGANAVDISQFYLHRSNLNDLFDEHTWNATHKQRFSVAIAAINTALKDSVYTETIIIDGI